MADDFDDDADTDELPATSQVFRVPADSPAAPGGPTGQGVAADPVGSPRGEYPRGDNDLVVREPEVVATTRPARFASSRRRALLWDAGWCLVTGVVLLVLAAADRPVDYGPPWATMVAGGAGVAWAAVLAGAAAGGVSRAVTTLVGLVNLAVGVGGFVLGWATPAVPTLLVVLAAQVAGFGLLQLVASLRH